MASSQTQSTAVTTTSAMHSQSTPSISNASTSTIETLPEQESTSKKHKPIMSIDTVLAQKPKVHVELPPKDTGRAALSILLAVVLLEGSTYGILLMYGVFQDHYQTMFVGNNTASWIGVLSEGLPYLGAPAVTWACQKYTLPRVYYIWAGFVLCVVALLASAFIDILPGLIVMQGLTYGLGALLVGIPELIVLNTWFDKRRGLAYGIVFAGADLFGVAYTFLATELLHRYTFRTTMLVFTSLTFVLAGPSILVLKERTDTLVTNTSSSTAPISARRRSSTLASALTPRSTTRTSIEDVPFSPSLERKGTWPAGQPKKRYYQRGIFYIFTIVNLLQSSAFFLPFIYSPSFVTHLGHNKQMAATVLAVGCFAMILGDLIFGKLSDMLDINLLIIASTAVSALATFVLWGFIGSGQNNLPAIIAFIFIFGWFGGGFIALWARMGTVFGEKDAQMVYSTLCFGRGVGGIISGPISQALIESGSPKMLQALGRGPYGGVIMFVGMCTGAAALLGVCAIVALRWKKDQMLDTEGASTENIEVTDVGKREIQVVVVQVESDDQHSR